ncbi:MAG: helix-turn-helix domain-containing protein [Caulobacteraceae bacterium]|nr:helix-turn-helix domain-containing protein [Caulobacteraceae bacterium]
MAGIETTRADDMARAGQALRILRKRSGLSQEAAAHEAGIHPQTWRGYEAGRRFMDNPTLATVTRALGSSPEEHALEVLRLTGPAETRSFASGMEERGRVLQLPVGGVAQGGAVMPAVFDHPSEPDVIDFASFFTPGTRVLRLAGMSMFPYADAGGLVTYNPRIPARRGQGAVIEMKDGSYLVKRFDRFDADHVHLTELYPEERSFTLPLDDVRGVYAIGLRGD